MEPQRKRGRPPKPGGTKATRMIRVSPDIADMIAWVARVEDRQIASIVDPLLRSTITARYRELEPLIKRIVVAEDAARRGALATT